MSAIANHSTRLTEAEIHVNILYSKDLNAAKYLLENCFRFSS